MLEQVLKIEGLCVSVHLNGTQKYILKDINFQINKGECVGLIGESGSGKSTTVHAILGLLSKSFNQTGSVLLNQKDWLKMKASCKRRVLAKEVGIILQNPMNAFDPLLRIEKQMNDYLKDYVFFGKYEMHKWLIGLLESVNISECEDVLKKYPHQLSGGMLQRIMIAIAMALEPALIIADEPTTAIDTKSQEDVIALIKTIKRKKNTGILFVSHDIGVVSKLADTVILLKEGEVIEQTECNTFMTKPQSAYGADLLACKLKMGGKAYAAGS